jgi:hypothetical protein
MIKVHTEDDGIICTISRKEIPQEYFYLTWDELKELASYLPKPETDRKSTCNDWGKM